MVRNNPQANKTYKHFLHIKVFSQNLMSFIFAHLQKNANLIYRLCLKLVKTDECAICHICSNTITNKCLEWAPNNKYAISVVLNNIPI